MSPDDYGYKDVGPEDYSAEVREAAWCGLPWRADRTRIALDL
jgi:hypothetical protein